MAVNEFEPVVSRRHPEISRYIESLREAGALPSMLSGSGSAVFGVFATADAAAAAMRADVSPLRGMTARRIATCSAERVERIELGS